jgi:hypothetical protein
MTEPTPPNDSHDEHEAYAGEPLPDPWDEPRPGQVHVHVTGQVSESVTRDLIAKSIDTLRRQGRL